MSDGAPSDPGRERILVGAAATSAYAMPLAVTLRSLVTNLSSGRSVTCYVLHGGLSEPDQRRVTESCAGADVEFHWIRMDDSGLRGLPSWGPNYAAYYCLFLPQYLAETVRTAIWLESDMVIVRDIGELWQQDPRPHALLAAQDLVVPHVSSACGVQQFRELGLEPDRKYFNSGVMVINLDWWRQNSVTNRVLSYLRRRGSSVHLADQGGLNAVLCGQWGELDPRWNVIESVAGRCFFKAPHLSEQQYRLVVEDPWIIHYAGLFKPWRGHMLTPARGLFFRYLDLTAWKGWRPRATLSAILAGIYERRLRDRLYPLERFCWSFRNRWN